MKDASRFVTESLKYVDKRNLSVMHTVIVPDRASLEAERQVLAALGGSFNVQVRTFRRLAADILPKFDYLSKQAGIMALSGIIRDNRDKLTCYTKGFDTSGFVTDMYDTISMMKYCRIAPRMLLADGLPRSVADKAHDIAVLYQGYLDYCENRFVDSADKMELLKDSVSSSQTVANSYFYIYDFDNLSVQELAVAEQLMLYGKGLTVACCTGRGGADKYLYLDDIYQGVAALCAKNGITPNIVEGADFPESHTGHIGRNLYRYTEAKPMLADGFAEIFQGSTRVQEVYSLACRIQNYVRQGGRFKDVYVVTSDVNKYYNAVNTVFTEFDIPYFCDRQFVLSAHPYARFVLDYFAVWRSNGRLDNVLSFVKNHLFCGNTDDVYLFENYCLKYNVNYRYDEFNLGRNEPYFERADRFREKFSALYKSVVIPNADTVSNYISLARRLIEQTNLKELNEKFADEQEKRKFGFECKVTRQASDKLEQVFVQAEKTLGDRYVKLDEFIKTLSMGVDAVKMSVLPIMNDCVIFANMAKARKHDVKFLALLGANYGAMPIIKKDCKLLTDANLKDLIKGGINVEPQIFTENKRERFSLFQLLQEPSEKLYVSYAETDGGNALTRSPFVDELCNLFSVDGKTPLAPTDTADENVYTKKQAISKVILNTRKIRDCQVVNMPAYAVLAEKYRDITNRYVFAKDGKNVKVRRGGEMYFKNARTSVSQLTDFFKCPYRFYIQYGLNVKPRDVAELKTADLGNILHSVLETYVRETDVRETNEITCEKAKKCFENALADDFYKGLRADPQMQGAITQLQTESIRLCQVVKEQLSSSAFDNLATELSFGDGDLPPVQVKFKDGQFNLVGKIDRVDVCGNRFIVIDYKSGAGAAHYGEKDLYLGHKMQLLVYVKAVKNLYPELRPAGFYYFNIHNNFSQAGAEKVYFYNGRTLDDADIACAIDTKLRQGKSATLGLRLKSNGELSKIGGNLLSDEQFDNQVKYAFELIAAAGRLMTEGYAAVKPYEGACDYCDYKDICYFNDVYSYDARKVTDTVNKNTIDKTVKIK